MFIRQQSLRLLFAVTFKKWNLDDFGNFSEKDCEQNFANMVNMTWYDYDTVDGQNPAPPGMVKIL